MTTWRAGACVLASALLGACAGTDPSDAPVALPAGALPPPTLLPNAEWSILGDAASRFLGTEVAFVGDVDGDGRPDLLTGTSTFDGDQTDEGRVALYLSAGGALATTPSWALDGDADGARLGHALVALGDVDGDHFDDFAVGAPGAGARDEGQVLVFHGSAAGPVPGTTISGGTDDAFLGSSLAAGDVDGDGDDDLIAGWGGTLIDPVANTYALTTSTSAGRLTVHLVDGGAVHTAADATVTPEGATAVVVGSGFDADGDGLDDVVAAAFGASTTSPFWLYRWNGTALAESFTGTAGALARPAGGDLDDDGDGDLVIGHQGRVELYVSTAGTFPATASSYLQMPDSHAVLRVRVTRIDGDDTDDLLVSANRASTANGLATARGGGVTLPTTLWTQSGPMASSSWGWGLDVGDVDGDGDADLVLGAPTDGSGPTLGGSLALYFTDHDEDGAGLDCDDADAAVRPGVAELPADGVDQNCDGAESCLLDADADDHLAASPVTTTSDDGDCDDPGEGTSATPTDDCDDHDGARHPGATEVCDAGNVDEDCDHLAGTADPSLDPNSQVAYFVDGDGDGFGSDATVVACDLPAGAAAASGDCDDADPAVRPSAIERTGDERDQNCDGHELCLADPDDDGFLVNSPGTVASDDVDCDDAFEASSSDPHGDCDDAALAIHPGATEVCNAHDDDCDRLVDEPDATDATSWYLDHDGDHFGDAASTLRACTQPIGYVAAAGDCDDARADVHLGAEERCDGVDHDCDGGTYDDDAVGLVDWHLDADADGHGDPAGTIVTVCAGPTGYAPNADDCDDTRDDVHPGADEHCDHVDHDCDGDIDDTDAVEARSWYVDADADGRGVDEGAIRACDAVDDRVDLGGDCDDADPTRAPGLDEVCDLIDQDCDGVPDDDAVDATVWVADFDADGAVDPTATTTACNGPDGYVDAPDAPIDCSDAEPTVHPGAPEVPCDHIDQDCDGADACAPVTGDDTDAGDTAAPDTDPIGSTYTGAECGCDQGAPGPGIAMIGALLAVVRRRRR